MTTVYMAWQNPAKSREWYPIGRLEADSPNGPFHFGYLHGAYRANREANLRPFVSFPKFEEKYHSDELFPLFKNRILSPKRKDFQEHLRILGLDSQHPDPMVILAVTEGRRQTDSLEVFPKLSPTPDGFFCCRFFLHGWRHLSDAAKERIDLLQADENLCVAVELNNPATTFAIQLQTTDYYMIGWAPRYLVQDLVSVVNESQNSIRARVVKRNQKTDPYQQRILIELSGKWPEGFSPMASKDYNDYDAQQ